MAVRVCLCPMPYYFSVQQIDGFSIDLMQQIFQREVESRDVQIRSLHSSLLQPKYA